MIKNTAIRHHDPEDSDDVCYNCAECSAIITSDEYIMQDGLCEDCFEEIDDDYL